jgi:molybdopterin-synthase adenylyltransferase
MPLITEINSILASLAQSHYLHKACILAPGDKAFPKNRNVVTAISGEIIIVDRAVQLCIGIQEDFPRSLPLVFLRPPNAFGVIPHLEADGYICYAQPEGLLLNVDDPEGILHDAVDLTIAVIEAGINSDNHLDFIDELPAYWEKLDSTKILGFFPVDDILRKVYVYSDRKGHQFVADSIDKVQSYFNQKRQDLNTFQRQSGLYIPLESRVFIPPPFPDKLWDTSLIYKTIEENLSWQNRERFGRLLRKRRFREFMILGIPRPSGGTVLVGLNFNPDSKVIPKGDAVADSPQPIEIERYDLDYLLPRGGGQSRLAQLKVALIGCGAVGGNIAIHLAQMGIRNLTLVDDDALQKENIYRHVLGKSAENTPKVVAMQNELERKYPYLMITAHQATLETAIKQGLLNLSTYDLVMVAMGNPTVELYLNRLLRQGESLPMSVFSWVEPYGIGGHALLTRPGQPGCLQCLFTPASDPEIPLYNRAAFAEANQTFAKDDLGCGSFYTPFAGLDAVKTAEQAVRLTIDGLLGYEKQSPLISWKGRADDFQAAGFKISSRYQQTENQLYENRYRYINTICSVCRARS